MVPEKIDEGFDRRMPSRRERREADSSRVGVDERRSRDEIIFGTRLGGETLNGRKGEGRWDAELSRCQVSGRLIDRNAKSCQFDFGRFRVAAWRAHDAHVPQCLGESDGVRAIKIGGMPALADPF